MLDVPKKKKSNNLDLIPTETVSSSEVTDNNLPDNTDRISNILHKERALYKSGVTRKLVYDTIREGLTATKTETRYLENGDSQTTQVPDLERRTRAAELALKAFGDLKEHTITGNVTHNTVIYKWDAIKTVNNINTDIQVINDIR